jgi:hypothetical protein
MCVVLPLEADLLAIEGAETVIRNGNTMGISAEIPKDLRWSAERGLGVNHPAPQMQPPEQFRKLFRIGEYGGRSAAAEPATLTPPLQSRDELAAEDFPQDSDRQEEIISRRYPAAVIGC